MSTRRSPERSPPSKLGIPIAHLEAGLRSFDRTMPEEINRIVADQLSRWCFTHSPEAAEQPRREGVGDERVFFVGNTMIDTLVRMRPAIARSTILDALGVALAPTSSSRCTGPRSSTGLTLPTVLSSLARLADWATVVFPVHPRTRTRVGPSVFHPQLRLIPPVGYVDFLALEAQARAVITDSGGVQEETTYLGVPCFTMRENTERPVTVSGGTNRLIGTEPAAIEEIPSLLVKQRRRTVHPKVGTVTRLNAPLSFSWTRSSAVPTCPRRPWPDDGSTRGRPFRPSSSPRWLHQTPHGHVGRVVGVLSLLDPTGRRDGTSTTTTTRRDPLHDQLAPRSRGRGAGRDSRA